MSVSKHVSAHMRRLQKLGAAKRWANVPKEKRTQIMKEVRAAKPKCVKVEV